jgi:hypothetical protein
MAMFTAEEIKRSILEDEMDASTARSLLSAGERERAIAAALEAWKDTNSMSGGEALWIGIETVCVK